jgi:hypothetical protein
MKVLLLTLYYNPDVAANAVLMTELAEELSARGHQVTVVTSVPHYVSSSSLEKYRGRLIQRESRGNIHVFRFSLFVPRRKGRLVDRLINYASFTASAALVGMIASPATSREWKVIACGPQPGGGALFLSSPAGGYSQPHVGNRCFARIGDGSGRVP